MTTDHIVMYGADWCGDCHRSRKFFDQHQIFYRWIDIDSDPHAEDFVRKINQGTVIIPTIFFLDGTYLVEPTNADLATKLGIPWQEEISEP
jgi:glutaredoxin-like protein